ncbi:MAG: sugar phosphate isomerase/epimerase [Spirochaetes bacterium]|nr:sugar phosphate isomerase/epimerase [Spirochaetota bacterium]
MSAKFAVITGFLGKTKDRFNHYNDAKTVEEKFSIVNQIKDMGAVEIVYPYEVQDPEITKSLLKKYNLEVAAVNVNVKAEPEFINGGLTSFDKEIRGKAVEFIKKAKNFAQDIGANKVTCCPLGDGYEFNFQYEYKKTWNFLIETFGEAGDHLPEIPLFIEYKPSETRGRCFIDTGAKTLHLLNEIGNENMGVTLDFGHSMYGNENPAEVVALCGESKYPFYIHINDNDARWDWDYMVGTKHYLDYVEFLYYLQQYNYTDYLTSDTSPTRWDIVGTFEQNTRLTSKIWNVLLEINKKELEKLINNGDYIQTWKFIEKNIFRL